MKRTVLILLAALMAISLIACGKAEPDHPGSVEEGIPPLAAEQSPAEAIPASDIPENPPSPADTEPPEEAVPEETPSAETIPEETSSVETVPEAAPPEEPAPEETPSAETVPEVAPPEEAVLYEADTEPVSGDLGEYHITILAAEDFVTMEGEPGIRFYYDFTNNSDSPAIAWTVLDTEARQDDYELVTAYAEYSMDVPEYSNDSLRIQPGMTIRCVREYAFKPLGGMMEFTVSDLLGSQKLTMKFDPNALQGRPEPLEMPTVEDPLWIQGVASDCDKETFYVQFHGYELTTNYDGNPAIRVYFEYTNKGEIPNAFFYDLNMLAFQDGVELQYAWVEESVQEEQNTSEEVPPGETVVVASVYDLRSESPVEFYVEAMWEDASCGVAVPVRSYPNE